MALPIYRLRRWLIAIAALFSATVAGMYFYARERERNILKEIPNKIGIDIKQTASGFQFSKSDGKRTLFTVQASKLKQFKLDGSAQLHNVSIVLYGRDSSRFDQIYGDDFTYDKPSGNITARGEVQIDLEPNPSGLTGPDQGAPKELKNPIHLKTQNLVFNQSTGDASTNARVDFRTPQASGWAIGMQYAAKSNTLTLDSEIHVTLGGDNAASLVAAHGTITRDPRLVVLDHPRLQSPRGTVESDQATLFLRPDNTVDRLLATGNVSAKAAAPNSEQMSARADEAEVLLSGKQNLLHTATLIGKVHVQRVAEQSMQGDAGRAVLDFSGQNELQKVHASEGVRLAQRVLDPGGAANTESQQNYDISSAAIDFFVKQGRRLDRAETSGAAQITIAPAHPPTSGTARNATQRTVITAGKFDARFTATLAGSRLAFVHGAPDAKIVSLGPELPDRVSTSRSVDAAFLPEGGISSIVQQGSVVFTDNQSPDKRTEAWADKALYTPADGGLLLSGNPRVADGGMVTTANSIRFNRTNNDAFAEGDVKSTYSDLKEQPDGALLASASPIHVTAATMTAHGSNAIALYQGKARLWQDANVIEAPSIEFDRDRRSLRAEGTAAQPVSTVLVQAAHASREEKVPPHGDQTAKAHTKDRAADAITVTSAHLTYVDADRRAHYEGNVTAKGASFTAFAKAADAFLVPRSQAASNQQLAAPGRLDHMVAEGSVIVQQPARRAEGQKLIYTAADDQFVLTGGPPSIFDAERGKITGVSLTFFRADDRVLVEGKASTPVVTQTRVAK